MTMEQIVKNNKEYNHLYPIFFIFEVHPYSTPTNAITNKINAIKNQPIQYTLPRILYSFCGILIFNVIIDIIYIYICFVPELKHK